MVATKPKKTNRACVIGLDGVPYSMIVELARRGIMSTMARLMDVGKIHKMKASLPEISSVSWTDFMTGANSGTHGIFGFTDFKPKSYAVRFPNFLDVKAPTIWDKLGAKGLKSIIINQPSTYPARKIPGADGLPNRHRHPQMPGKARGPLARAQQDHGRRSKGPELLLG
jgi:predicted AlkP superfamily phosphohydrolase/phosphomutase